MCNKYILSIIKEFEIILNLLSSYSNVGKFFPDPYNGYQDVSVGDDLLKDEFKVFLFNSCILLKNIIKFLN